MGRSRKASGLRLGPEGATQWQQDTSIQTGTLYVSQQLWILHALRRIHVGQLDPVEDTGNLNRQGVRIFHLDEAGSHLLYLGVQPRVEKDR